MALFDRIVGKATGRKMFVFVTATALLCAGVITQDVWVYVAVGTGGFIALEKLPVQLGKAKSDA